MTRAFVHDHWLLQTATARRLYHDVASPLPLIDYHCHLDPADLAGDRAFANFTELAIEPDPYKHRAMRITGVPEAEITGRTSPRSRFDHWGRTVPASLGNPLYAWTALELNRYFNIDEPLNAATAEAVWQSTAARLGSDGMTARGLLEQANVRCICTSDRLLDNLSHHETLASSNFSVRVLPSLRGDDILAIDSDGYTQWLADLARETQRPVDDFASFCEAVSARLDAFVALGCRLADHGLDRAPQTGPCLQRTAELFCHVVRGKRLEPATVEQLKAGLLHWLVRQYAARGWVLQLHLGAQRQTSARLRRLAGPAGGYATIGDSVHVADLCAFLDSLEREAALPRVILYPLHPGDFAPLATLTGSFAADGVRGLIQLGPAWWYNDQSLGIRQHLEALSSYGLVSTFIGMTTDSRSLLSMVRHEYFRRELCNWVGTAVETGVWPDDPSLLDALIRGVCHDNAAAMLNLDRSPGDESV